MQPHAGGAAGARGPSSSQAACELHASRWPPPAPALPTRGARPHGRKRALSRRAGPPPPQSQVMRPDAMNERLARFWAHKHWKVRHGLLQFVAEAVCMLGSAALDARDAPEPHAMVGQVLRLVEDPERWVGGRGLGYMVWGRRAPAPATGWWTTGWRDAAARCAQRPSQLTCRRPTAPRAATAPCATPRSSAWRRCMACWASH